MNASGRRPQLVAVVLLVLMGLAHVVPAMLAGKTLVTNDYGAQFLPAFATLQGRIPFFGAPSWNPAIFGGAPAESLPAMPRYPLALMGYLFSPERAVPLFVGIHLALAAVSAFFFLRITARSSVIAAFVGAEIYAFGGTLWIHGMHGENLAVAAWLPAIAASAWSCGRRRPLGPVALALTTAAALSVGGGVPLLFFAVVASAVALFVGMGSWREIPRVAPAVAVALFVALLVSLPGWLPFVEVVRGASRGTLSLKDASAFALSPPMLLRVAAPSLCYEGDGACAWPWYVERWCYVGILTLPLAGLGARDLMGKRLLLALFATVLLSFGSLGVLHLVFYWVVPGYALLRAPGRWIFLAGLLAALLAARGLDSLFAGDAKPALRRAIGAMAVFALLSVFAFLRWYAVPQDPLASTVHVDFALATVFALAAVAWLGAVLAGAPLARLAPIAALLLGTDLLVTAVRVDVSEPIAAAAAPRIVREVAAAAGETRVSHDDAAGGFFLDGGVRWGYRNARGYSQLVPEPYSRLLDLGPAQDWHFSGLPARHDPALLALLGAGVWLGPGGAPPEGFGGEPLSRQFGLAAWRSLRPPFTAALVSDFRVEPPGDPERAAALTVDPDRTAVLVVDPAIARATSAGTLSLARATDQLTATIDARHEALAVIGESWHPRWRATIDGVPAAILRADAIWMAVQVPPGRHQLVLRCRAAVPLWGWLASLAGLGGAGMLYWRRRMVDASR